MAKRSPKTQSRKDDWPRGMFKRGDSRTYFWERQHQGVRYKEPIGSSRERAYKRAVELNEALDRGDLPQMLRKADKRLIAAFMEEVLGSRVREESLSKKTVAAFQNRIRLLCRYLEERHRDVIRVDQLTPHVAAGYVAWRRTQRVSRSGKGQSRDKRPPSSVTINDDVRKLRTLFHHAVRHEMIDTNPFANVRPSKKASERKVLDRPLSDRDVSQLLRAARRYDEATDPARRRSTFRGIMHDMIAFYLLTGLRKEELIFLPWAHVDLEWGEFGRIRIEPVSVRARCRLRFTGRRAEALTVLASRRAGEEHLFTSRQAVRRYVPKRIDERHGGDLLGVPPRAWNQRSGVLVVYTGFEWRQKATQGSVPLERASREIIDRRLAARKKHGTFVFPHPNGGALKSDPLPEFKKVLRAAKLPQRIRIHDLRHTFAFTLRDRGVPIETICGLMRHANIEETMIYAPYRLEEGARRIAGLGDHWRL